MKTGDCKRIFIVGPPRTGTTLCQSIIMASGTVFSFPESHFFNYLPGGRGRFKSLRNILAYRRLSSWASRSGFKKRPGLFLTRYGGIRAFGSLLDREAKFQGYDIWLEKTPSHLKKIKEIASAYENVYVIFMARKLEDTVASLLKELPGWKKFLDEADVGYAVSRWYGDMALVRARSLETRSIVVEYENLVSNFESEVRRLYHFLGLSNPEVVSSVDLSEFSRKVILDDETWKQNNLRSSINYPSRRGELKESEKESINNMVRYLEGRAK